MHTEHVQLLEKRYAEAGKVRQEKGYPNNGVPDFSGSAEGLENMLLRCIKDYCANPSPEGALKDGLAWIKQAYERGRLEERERIEDNLLAQTKKLSAEFIANAIRQGRR